MNLQYSQADPQFRSTLSYTRLSAASVRRALVQEKGWREEDLPAPRTLNSILNRLGYRLRSVAKTQPEKTAHTEAIFANVRRVNAQAGADPEWSSPEKVDMPSVAAWRLV